MRSSRLILAAAAVLLVVGPAGASEVLNPGETLDFVSLGAAVPCETGTSTTPSDNVDVTADAACDEVLSQVMAESLINGVSGVAADSQAEAALHYDFMVSTDTETAGNVVDGHVSYSVSWAGVKTTVVDGQATVDLTLTVLDITDPNNPMTVAEVELHEDGIGRDICTDVACVDVELGDAGSESGVISMPLVRGNSYRVVVGLETAANLLSTVDPATVISDYMDDILAQGTDGGAVVDVLMVSAGIDLAELAAQVAANTAQIAKNTMAIEDLETVVGDIQTTLDRVVNALQELQQELDDLELEFQSHTHTYLTGRGVGHNNTEATTAAPDDGDPVPDPRDSVRKKRGNSRSRR